MRTALTLPTTLICSPPAGRQALETSSGVALVTLHHAPRAAGHGRSDVHFSALCTSIRAAVRSSAVPRGSESARRVVQPSGEERTLVSPLAVDAARAWTATQPTDGTFWPAGWVERGGPDVEVPPETTAYQDVGDRFNGWYEGSHQARPG